LRHQIAVEAGLQDGVACKRRFSSAGGAIIMHWIALPCPHCGKTKAYHRIPSTRYAPAAPVLFGGVILALVFDRSRKPQFRCESCGTAFYSHTFTSRIFLLFWAFYVFCVILFLATVILIPIFNWFEDHWYQ
jgi:predicted RNA-binding Zn-ribbon protein involved in translation (DUF1610 family)